jgi:hypothetical protein
MPPRHAYWTILIGNAPTAFRAHDRADLLPTFERLRQKQPDVTVKYFARGRLWESPEAAREESVRRPAAETRGRDWRPGGAHRDPRDRFKTKRDKPKFNGPRRDRPSGSEERGGWAPTRTGTAKPSSFGKRRPFGSAKPFRTSPTPENRKPFGDKKPFGGKRPFGGKKPFGDRKRFENRKPGDGGAREPHRDRPPFGDRKPPATRKPFRERSSAPPRPDETKPAPEAPHEKRVASRRNDGTKFLKKKPGR